MSVEFDSIPSARDEIDAAFKQNSSSKNFHHSNILFNANILDSATFKSSIISELLNSRGFVSAKSELLGQIVQTLKKSQSKLPSKKFADSKFPQSIQTRIILSLILNYLTANNFHHTGKLLLSELGVESFNQASFTSEDELSLLKFDSALKQNVYQEFQAIVKKNIGESQSDENQNENERKKFSLLTVIVTILMKPASNLSTTTGCQTDSNEFSVDSRGSNLSLDEKLASLDKEFPDSKKSAPPVNAADNQNFSSQFSSQQSVQSSELLLHGKLLAYQNEIKIRLEKEMAEKFSAFQSEEISIIKQNEKSQYQQALHHAQSALHSQYKQQIEILTQRADSLTQELINAKSHFESESFQQRQAVLTEINKLKSRESELAGIENVLLEKQQKLNSLISQSEQKMKIIDERFQQTSEEFQTQKENILQQKDQKIQQLIQENQNHKNIIHAMTGENQNFHQENVSLKDATNKLQTKFDSLVIDRESLQTKLTSLTNNEFELKSLRKSLIDSQFCLKESEFNYKNSMNEIKNNFSHQIKELQNSNHSALVKLSHEWKVAYESLTSEFEICSEEKFQLEKEIQNLKLAGKRIKRKNKENCNKNYQRQIIKNEDDDDDDTDGNDDVYITDEQNRKFQQKLRGSSPLPTSRVFEERKENEEQKFPTKENSKTKNKNPTTESEENENPRTPKTKTRRTSSDQQQQRRDEDENLSAVDSRNFPSNLLNQSKQFSPLPEQPTTLTLTPFNRLLPVDTAMPSPLIPLTGRALTLDELSSQPISSFPSFSSPLSSSRTFENSSLVEFSVVSELENSLDDSEVERQAIIAAQQARVNFTNKTIFSSPSSPPSIDANNLERAEAERKVREERERIEAEAAEKAKIDRDIEAARIIREEAETKMIEDRERREEKLAQELKSQREKSSRKSSRRRKDEDEDIEAMSEQQRAELVEYEEQLRKKLAAQQEKKISQQIPSEPITGKTDETSNPVNAPNESAARMAELLRQARERRAHQAESASKENNENQRGEIEEQEIF